MRDASSPSSRRCFSFALIALALIMRLAVPAGWMPSGSGLSIMPCPAAGPVPMAMAAHGPMKMADHQGAPHKHGDDQNHNCPFAPQAAALDFARLPDVLLPPRPEPRLAQAFPRAVGIGSGLAAPPPPQTGPPFLT